MSKSLLTKHQWKTCQTQPDRYGYQALREPLDTSLDRGINNLIIDPCAIVCEIDLKTVSHQRHLLLRASFIQLMSTQCIAVMAAARTQPPTLSRQLSLKRFPNLSATQIDALRLRCIAITRTKRRRLDKSRRRPSQKPQALALQTLGIEADNITWLCGASCRALAPGEVQLVNIDPKVAQLYRAQPENKPSDPPPGASEDPAPPPGPATTGDP